MAFLPVVVQFGAVVAVALVVKSVLVVGIPDGPLEIVKVAMGTAYTQKPSMAVSVMICVSLATLMTDMFIGEIALKDEMFPLIYRI